MKQIYNITATYFINELTSKLLPTPRDNVVLYNRALDGYTTAVCGFIGQVNPAYEAVHKNLMSFITKYKPSETNESVLHLVCTALCPPGILTKLKTKDRETLFRRFLSDCIKKMVILTLSYSKEIIMRVNNNTPEELRKFRLGLIVYFEDILLETQQNIFIEFSGNSSGETRRIHTEQKIISELRSQNEDLQFRILKLTEEVQKLKRELAQHNQLDDEEEE